MNEHESIFKINELKFGIKDSTYGAEGCGAKQLQKLKENHPLPRAESAERAYYTTARRKDLRIKKKKTNLALPKDLDWSLAIRFRYTT